MKPLIDREYSLEQAAEAHIEVIEHTHGTLGRILINTDCLIVSFKQTEF